MNPVIMHQLAAVLVALSPALVLATAPGPAGGAPAPQTPAPAGAEAAAAANQAAPGEAAEAPKRGPRVTLEAPLFAEEFAEFPVATVDGDPIPLRDITDALATAHMSRKGDSASRKQDLSALLDRMIDARLLALEGLEMGMDELEDTKAALAGFEERLLTEMLQQRATKDAKADPAEVERLYKESVRQWKTKSALFGLADDATAARKAIAAGQGFDEVVAKAVADKKAQGGAEGDYVAADKLLPEVLAVLTKLEVGGISQPIRLQSGYALLRLDDIRYPEDASKRADAEAAALQEARKETLKKYYDGLLKKHAKPNRKLMAQIDMEKKPLASFAGDKRVLASFKGAKPITVAELATELSGGFYHGSDNAAKSKRINARKVQQFEALVSKRIVEIESAAQRLRETDEFQRRVSQYRYSTMFTRVLEKVIIPDIDVTPEEVQAYYDAHKAEYTLPAFYKLQGIGFPSVKDAQAAHDKLTAGTDFKWLKANTESLPERRRVAAIENGSTLSARAIPADLAKALSTTSPGDYRLFSPSDEVTYVVQVLEVTPEAQQALEGDVQEKIAKTIFLDEVGKAIKDRAQRLREFHDIKIFITGLGE